MAFPAKSFVIKLEGTKGDDENDWNSDYAQDAQAIPFLRQPEVPDLIKYRLIAEKF